MKTISQKIIFGIIFSLIATVGFSQNWQLVWQDEFNNGISSDWVFETGGGGWGNNELEYYRAENASVQNGNLVMTAKRENYGGREYTSVRMKTQGRKSWKYGKVEARIAMPAFSGIWPAFWMLGDNISSIGWPKCGEIDIMEHVNTGTEVVGTIHWDNGGHQEYGGRTNTDNLNNFHTYAIEWNANEIKWFIDGRQYHVANIANNINGTEEFHNNFFILLNLAVGGNWPGFNIDNGQFPTSMLVDYVRVYQDNGVPPIPSSTGLITVYNDCNYSGFSGGLELGDYNLARLKSLGVNNDVISSLKITEGYQAILYQDDNFSGGSTVINSDNTCLNTTWNDKVSSIRVLPNGATNLGGVYMLQNRYSGLNMDVWGGSTSNGSNIAQANPSNTNINQQFTFTHLGNGLYKIIANVSGKSLDINSFSKADGANVEQYTYNATVNQQFILVPVSGGYYKIIPSHSGKVVEVGGWSTVSGGNVQQWSNVNQESGHWKLATLTTTPQIGNGTGLTGNYFNGMNFETPVYSRTDATINFNWGNGSPNGAVDADRFSTRWTGQIQAKYSGEHTFYINSDNGRRLWVNGQLVIDKWIDDWNIDYSGKITLTAGQKYDIKIEYFENYGGAGCKLEWSSSDQSREVVPTSQLYPNPLPSVSISSPSNNASFNAPASFTVSANASDNVSIAKVEFYNGSTKLGEDNTSPYSVNVSNLGVGTYVLTARAYDNKGAVSISGSVSVSVKTSTTPTNQAPTVSLTGPSNGSSYNAPASIVITANASDADGSVTKVEFYNGSTKLGEDASAPYSLTWSNVSAGTYSITAKAFDNSNASTTSGSVSVKVNTVVTDACSGLAVYSENNGYVAGSKVKNAGKQYECKEWPYSGWCNGASWAYAPGTGAYWQDAWYERGTCNARSSSDVSTNSTLANEELVIAPNPVTNQLTISSSLNLSESTITINDIAGRTLINEVNTNTIDVSALKSGIYTITIVTQENNKITKRFLKQ